MKLLAFSDLHGRQKALDKLLELEKDNQYDAILLAGDLGVFHESYLDAVDVIEQLKVFDCPVYFVLGNSDPEHIKTDIKWPEHAKELTLSPTPLGDYTIIGKTGIHDLSQPRSVEKQLADKERQIIAQAVNEHDLDPGKTILITHERLYKIDQVFDNGNLLLYLFGHHHRPAHSYARNTNYINCSALDGSRSRWGAGVYWIIDIEDGKVSAIPKPIERPKKNGVVLGMNKGAQQIKMFNQLWPDFNFKPKDGWSIIFPTDKSRFG